MAKRTATPNKKIIVVSIQLAAQAKTQLDQICESRGMTIKSLLGRLIEWFHTLDKTEQSIVLGQVEAGDVRSLAQLTLSRK